MISDTTKRRIIKVSEFTALAVAGLAWFFLAKELTVVNGATTGISVTPYTQEREAYRFDSDPKGTLFAKESVAMRADGAEAVSSTAMGATGLEEGLAARKVIFPDGRMFTIEDWIKAKTTWQPMSAKAVDQRNSRLAHPPENCVAPGETLVGFGELLNHKVALVRWPQSGNERVTQSQAIDLGCQSLLDQVEDQQPDGSWAVVAETRTASVTIGQPDPTLFETGAAYAEMSPSQMLRTAEAYSGTAASYGTEQTAKAQDKAYIGELAR